MRKLRNAAIAAAAATALTLGATSVATAETYVPPREGDIVVTEGSSIPVGSSEGLGDNLNGQNEADGRALFGSSKVNPETGATFDGQPAWAKLLYGLTVTGAIGSVIGLIVGPLYNFIVHGQ
ncbi:hypothetical protein COCCU_01070 [Corynebacterium occultum]|uniref:Or membrane protein n=1 Tax=Corynebacterium occultum TaxID=2675219 RepID=A0A6B8VL63_9CORY|nr:hypothetical protein [Corynebacterium occultum]QGU06182.1 hypothetical protein COCCU_01070 [Corynebacterium occultum]